MSFIVRFTDGETTTYPDEVKFTIGENGVLVIRAERSRLHFSPTAWVSVEAEIDPKDRKGSVFS